MKPRKHKELAHSIRLNFLLGCADGALADFELARLAAVADLRKQLHAVLDMMIEQTAEAELARWFRESDRESIKRALDEEESPMDLAVRLIRERDQSEEELLPLPSLPRGAAHLAAALRYTERNIAEGKCGVCPQPLARNSVRYCEKHLTAARLRHKPKGAKGEEPGSIGYLYSEDKFESRHGRQPGTLAALEMAREQKTRALLAEMGISPESAAVSLKAAKEALLKCMPDSEASATGSEADAATADVLFQTAMISSPGTGKTALKELLAAGAIQRVGMGKRGNPFRYFAKPTVALQATPEAEKGNRSKQVRRQSKGKNEALLTILRGKS